MKKTIFSTALVSSFVLLFGLAHQAAAQPADAAFQWAVAEYQRSPTAANAKMVIKLALTMKPVPAVPEEARRHYVKGRTLFDAAKNPADSLDAAEEFKNALLIAPWWGELYLRLGMTLETAERYDEAIAALKLYMVSAPGEELARKAQDEIYKIEAEMEKAEHERRAQETAAEAKRVAEAHKQEGRDVLARLRRIVAGADYDRIVASALSPSGRTHTILNGASTMPGVGVTERESEESTWYNWGNSCERFVFEDERVLICFVADSGFVNRGHPDLIGTPNGSAISDMIWESPYDAVEEQTLGRGSRRVWAHVNENNGSITWSPDRPTSSTGYDPSVRYGYWLYRRH